MGFKLQNATSRWSDRCFIPCCMRPVNRLLQLSEPFERNAWMSLCTSGLDTIRLFCNVFRWKVWPFIYHWGKTVIKSVLKWTKLHLKQWVRIIHYKHWAFQPTEGMRLTQSIIKPQIIFAIQLSFRSTPFIFQAFMASLCVWRWPAGCVCVAWDLSPSVCGRV